MRPKFVLASFQATQKKAKRSAAELSRQLLDRLDKDKQDAFLVWDDALTREAYDSQVIAIVTTRLHRQKRFDEAVEGLQAAIRHGLAEPWMYDVLAVEMKLAGRPQKQIDRVLLSRIDFSAGNDAQMLVAASNLAAFDAYKESLSLCKELAKRNPHQPELWSTARRVADLSGELDVRAWARVQTLHNVWESGFESLHKKMEAELKDLLEEATKTEDPQIISDIREAFRDGVRRDIRVQIEWVGDGDLDLSIREPDGEVCSRRKKVTTNGGMLVKQDVPVGSTNKRQSEEYVCVDALPGKYVVKVEHIDGRILLGRVQLKITRNSGTISETTEMKSLSGVVETPGEFEFQFSR